MAMSGATREAPYKMMVTTSNPFEQKFGYHRAVRRGPFIAVSGTTALRLLPTPLSYSEEHRTADDKEKTLPKVHCPGDAYGQAIHIFDTCLAAIEDLGGKREDVIRVRMFVANGDQCGVVGDAFRDKFGFKQVDPNGNADKQDSVAATATMIVVPGGFVDKEILVEIEVDAFVL